MKKVFLLSVLCLCFLQSAMSINVFIVTENRELEIEGGGKLGDWLRSQGMTVDVDEDPGLNVSGYEGELTAAEIAHLESYDVVIISRAVTSGDHNSPTIFQQWNNLRVPLICGSAYLARNIRFYWVEAGQQRTNLWNGVDIVAANHPIVRGRTGEFFDIELGIDHLAPGDIGQGTLVASILNANGQDANAIVAWEPNQAFTAGGGQTHNQARVFLPLYRYHEVAGSGFGNQGDPADGDFVNYTQNGLNIIKQAIEWLATFKTTSDVADWQIFENQ